MKHIFIPFLASVLILSACDTSSDEDFFKKENEPVDYVFKKTKMKEKYWLDFAFEKRNEYLLSYLLSNRITKTNFEPELKQLLKDN